MNPNVKLPEWAERVLQEENELRQKAEKLLKFINSDGFNKINDLVHQALLLNQHVAMSEYHAILQDRINLIKKELL